MTKSKDEISLRKLARDYGYDHKSVMAWRERNMPTDSEENAREWIIQNILKPLRVTDTREQIERERLRKLKYEADIIETEYLTAINHLIPVDEVEAEMTKFVLDIRNYIRSLPNRISTELFEQESASKLKTLLKDRIDEMLNEIGDCKHVTDDIIKTKNIKED